MHKVILIDDHPLFRSGTCDIISELEDYRIVGEFSSGDEALAAIVIDPPDLAFIDISLPDISGFEVLQKAQILVPTLKCIVLTMHEDDQYAKRAIELGAKAYLVKTEKKETLLQCITCVVNGGIFISNNIDSNIKTTGGEEMAKLSTREIAVILLIAEGYTSKSIGEKLFLSPRTIQNHRTNICSKLGIQGSNTLLKFAIENEGQLEILHSHRQ